ncbi:hypothetical protein ACFRFL_27790 [Streptomyces sp. NPDC056708]|uniref:hypothetical protein n=1 Tax=unclassified Streptomyces TaxID=2593676 RepID=UPI0036A0D2F5
MTGWTGRTAVEIADAVRRGDVTPRQVVVEHLERIRRLHERLGAFRAVLDEEALAAADALADRKNLLANTRFSPYVERGMRQAELDVRVPVAPQVLDRITGGCQRLLAREVVRSGSQPIGRLGVLPAPVETADVAPWM